MTLRPALLDPMPDVPMPTRRFNCSNGSWGEPQVEPHLAVSGCLRGNLIRWLVEYATTTGKIQRRGVVLWFEGVPDKNGTPSNRNYILKSVFHC